MVKVLLCQGYLSADPFYLLTFEQQAFKTESNFTQLSLRPSFYNIYNDSSIYSLKIRSEIFYNTNAPNLENMSDRWIGKGFGLFNSFNFSFRTKYVMGSIEPYYFIDQNAKYDEPMRIPLLSQLNDNNSHHEESPFQAIGIREGQFYLHYKGVGAGISNANMWWGQGIHSSLVMSNNTSGFTHILLGTLEEKRYKNLGLIGRYIFSKFDDRNKYEPYFTSVILGLTYYSDPIVSIGITKSALTGGTSPRADSVSWAEAALAFLKGFTAGDVKTYKDRWSYDDHTISTYISTYFPKSQLTIFLEIGRTDITLDFNNFILTPDHSIATNFGLRKYNLFNNKNLFFGMEYIKLFAGRRYAARMPDTGPWYSKSGYEYNSFNGRNFAAHSGPDSDDYFIYFGWMNNDFLISPSFDYERHDIKEPAIQLDNGETQSFLFNPWPETKFEFRLDLRFKLKSYNFNCYLEEEIVKNLEFKDKTRTGTVIWVGIERSFNTEEIRKLFQNIFLKND